jgi:hypothetical protein
VDDGEPAAEALPVSLFGAAHMGLRNMSGGHNRAAEKAKTESGCVEVCVQIAKQRAMQKYT